jgi:hypothetical protein
MTVPAAARKYAKSFLMPGSSPLFDATGAIASPHAFLLHQPRQSSSLTAVNGFVPKRFNVIVFFTDAESAA